MFAGDLRGLGAARIDHHQFAARGQRLEPLGDVRRGHQAAVGNHRIGAEHQEIIGAIDIGNRQQELVPVHRGVDELVRPLVDRRRAEQIRRAQCLEQCRQVGDVAEMVHVGIAQVHRDRACAVRLLHGGEFLAGQRESLVPADRLPLRAGTAHRLGQPVRVRFQVEHGIALGADMATAERIGRIAPDRGQLAVLELQVQPADGFTQGAGAIAGNAGHGVLDDRIRSWRRLRSCSDGNEVVERPGCGDWRT